MLGFHGNCLPMTNIEVSDIIHDSKHQKRRILFSSTMLDQSYLLLVYIRDVQKPAEIIVYGMRVWRSSRLASESLWGENNLEVEKMRAECGLETLSQAE
ncbi:uncharacterized [Tachysurus ichikawai]